MDCKQALQLLDPYVDRELNAASLHDVESHLIVCPECRQKLEQLQNLRDKIKSATSFKAPASTRAAMIDAVPRGNRPALRLAQAVALAAVVCLAWFVGRSQQGEISESEVVLSHVHSLMAEHLTDVLSTDKHTVKPWFNGKIDFSPPVVDLKPQGFPLVGGRLDMLGGKRAAVLVYHRQKHVIDLYISLGSSGPKAQTWQSRGYNVIHWQGGDFEFWAVSDLNTAELAQFAELYKQAE